MFETHLNSALMISEILTEYFRWLFKSVIRRTESFLFGVYIKQTKKVFCFLFIG